MPPQRDRSRRDCLRLCGVVGLGSLAGCLRLQEEVETDGDDSNGSGDSQQSGDTGSETVPEETLTDAFDIEHAAGSQSSSGSTTDDGRRIQTEKINIEPTERYLFGGGVDRQFRIEEAESGRSVTITPAADAGTYLVERVRPEMDATGQPEDEITVFTPEGDDIAERLPVSYDGEPSMFTETVFGTYTVELPAGSETLASTGEQLVGMGYSYAVEQSEDELRVTRHPDVREAWFARFVLEDDLDVVTVDHQDGDEFFRVDLTQLDVPSGQYGWSLELFPSLERMQEQRGSRIVAMRSPRDSPVIVE